MEPVVGVIAVVAAETFPPDEALKRGRATGMSTAGAASQPRRASTQITTAGQTNRQTDRQTDKQIVSTEAKLNKKRLQAIALQIMSSYNEHDFQTSSS